MSKLHLVPQAVLDCGENFKTAPPHSHLKDMHLERLEETKKYIDSVIIEYNTKLFKGK